MPAISSQRLWKVEGLSGYQLDKLIACFASGDSAAAAMTKTRLPYQKVRRIYELIRRRLIEIGYIPSLSARLSWVLDEDGDEEAFDRQIAEVMPELNKRHGVSDRLEDEYIAELLFRREEQDVERAHGKPLDRSTDMKRALRLAGPLDRPLSPFRKRKVSEFLLARTLDKGIDEAQAALDLGLESFIASFSARSSPPPGEGEAGSGAFADDMRALISSYRQRMKSLRSSRRGSKS